MSLLDVINNRISELQAATDAKYKAAGYEIPTASQRKAAEFSGQNPYEYATQLKQIETQQKEAEKAAKAAQKQAARASRQSSRSSGSSYSSSGSSSSYGSDSEGGTSDLWGSVLGESEDSETIPSIKSMKQLQDESFKIKQARRRKKGAEKVLRDYNEARMEAAAENFKENRPKKKGDKKHSTYGDEEERTTETPSVLAAQQGNLGDDFKREREEARQEEELREQIPSLPENLFAQGTMEGSLYDIRNAEMADKKAQADAAEKEAAELEEFRTNLANGGLSLSQLAQDAHMTEKQYMEKIKGNQERMDTLYSHQGMTIDSSNVSEYLDPNKQLDGFEQEAAEAYVDSYRKSDEYNKVRQAIWKLQTESGVVGNANYSQDAWFSIADNLYEYNKTHGTDYNLNSYLRSQGITYSEYEEYKNVEMLDQKISDLGAFGNAFLSTYNNIGGLMDEVNSYIPWTPQAAEKRRLEEDSAYAMAKAVEENRAKKVEQGQATQSPFAYGVGRTADMVVRTAISNGILNGSGLVGKVAEYAGGGKLAYALAEVGLDTALVDIPTDTIPEMIENYNNGMPLDEVLAKAGINILANAAINVGVDVAAPAAIKALTGGGTVKQVADTAEDVIPGMNNADSLVKSADDVDIDALVKQREEALKTIEDLQKQIPEVPDVTDGMKATDFGTPETPVSVVSDIDSYAKQWDDYVGDLGNTKAGSLEIANPNLEDVAIKTYADYVSDISKASDDELMSIIDQASNSLRMSSITEEQFESLINLANAKYNSIPNIANTVADTVTDTMSGATRKGLDIVDAAHENATVGEVVSYYTDTMKDTSNSFGTKYADLIEKNPGIKESYERLNKSIDDFTNAALHSEDDLGSYYKEIDNSRKQLSNRLKKIDEAAAKDPALGNSNISVLKQADRAKYEINSVIKDSNVDESADWITSLEEAAKAEEVPNISTSSLAETGDNLRIETINSKKGPRYHVVSDDGNIIRPVETGKTYKTKEAAEEALERFKAQSKSQSSSVPGAEPLQFFGGGGKGDGKWKTSKWRTNTAEKTGLIKNADDIPAKDYAYHVFTEERQKEIFKQRYADTDDVVAELLKPDHPFDAVDVRGAQAEWAKLMEAGDEQSLKRANRLGRKIASETREGGRTIQALAEATRNTPEGQMRTAQKSLNDMVDKTVGEGTSESLDNLVKKIEDAYELSNGDKDVFKKKVEELMQGDLKKYAPSKTAKNMKPKKITGKKDVLTMIEEGADIDAITEVIYKQNGGVRLTPQEQKQIFDYLTEAQKAVPESYEQELLLGKAAKIAQAKAPSTVGDKFKSILYDNMLGNFKTAISRNAFGNLAYQSLEQARQPITAAVDKLVSKFTGQHSALGWNKAKRDAYIEGFKQGTKDQFADTFLHRIDTGRSGSKGWEEALKNNATTWNDTKAIGRFANNVDFYVKNALEFGDRPFFEANYKQAYVELEQMLTRFGKEGVYGLADVADDQLPAVMDMIASVRAADAVFQKHGYMSKGLTDLRNGLGNMSRGAVGVDILSTQSTPFTMTPGNMIERAIEYTPLGAVKNTAETLYEVLGKKGFDQRRFVDEASRTITGLPMLWGAYELASNTDPESIIGSINGSYSSDPDEKKAQQEDGYIEYGYNVPNWVPYYGGKTLDTSDLPVLGPFMQAGARMAEEGIDNPEAWMQAAEAILGGSTTQGLRKVFGGDSPSYSGSDSVVNNFLNTIGSSGSQLVPSLLRQTAQTTDPYKRDLGEYGTMDYYWNMLLNNIPGLRETLPVKTNVEGEPVLQNQGRTLPEKILENYLLPMNVSEYDPSPLNQEASALLESTGSAAGFVPKAGSRNDVRDWDEKAGIEYSEDQYLKYKQNLGSLNSEAGNALISSEGYQELSDTYKVKALSDLYSGMKAVAKEDATGITSDDKVAAAYREGGMDAAIEYVNEYYKIKDAAGDSSVTVNDTTREIYENGITVGGKTVTGEDAIQLYIDAGEWCKENGLKNSKTNRAAYYSEHINDYNTEDEDPRHQRNRRPDNVEIPEENVPTASQPESESIPSLAEMRENAIEARKTIMESNKIMRELNPYYSRQQSRQAIPGLSDTENMSETDKLIAQQEQKAIMEQYGLSYSKDNAKLLDKYGETALEAKAILSDADYSFGDNEKKLYKDGGVEAVRNYVETRTSLEDAGLDTSYKIYDSYLHALENYPGMTPTQYANAVKSIDQNDNSEISQKEILAYIEANGLTVEQAEELCRVLGNWTTTPYITKKGTWAMH